MIYLVNKFSVKLVIKIKKMIEQKISGVCMIKKKKGIR